MLKGAGALLARLPVARHSKDIDLYYAQRAAGHTSLRIWAACTRPSMWTSWSTPLADALGVQLRLEVADATDLPAVTFGAA